MKLHHQTKHDGFREEDTADMAVFVSNSAWISNVTLRAD